MSRSILRSLASCASSPLLQADFKVRQLKVAIRSGRFVLAGARCWWASRSPAPHGRSETLLALSADAQLIPAGGSWLRNLRALLPEQVFSSLNLQSVRLTSREIVGEAGRRLRMESRE